MCGTCLKLTINIPERLHWLYSGVFSVNFKQISHIVLVFPSLTLNSCLSLSALLFLLLFSSVIVIVNSARCLRYVWLFFNIKHESFNIKIHIFFYTRRLNWFMVFGVTSSEFLEVYLKRSWVLMKGKGSSSYFISNTKPI